MQSFNEKKTACQISHFTDHTVINTWHNNHFTSSTKGLKTMTHLWVTENTERHVNSHYCKRYTSSPVSVKWWCLWVLSPATCNGNDEAGEHDLVLSVVFYTKACMCWHMRYPTAPLEALYISHCIYSVWAVLLSVRGRASSKHSVTFPDAKSSKNRSTSTIWLVILVCEHIYSNNWRVIKTCNTPSYTQQNEKISEVFVHSSIWSMNFEHLCNQKQSLRQLLSYVS